MTSRQHNLLVGGIYPYMEFLSSRYGGLCNGQLPLTESCGKSQNGMPTSRGGDWEIHADHI